MSSALATNRRIFQTELVNLQGQSSGLRGTLDSSAEPDPKRSGWIGQAGSGGGPWTSRICGVQDLKLPAWVPTPFVSGDFFGASRQFFFYFVQSSR